MENQRTSEEIGKILKGKPWKKDLAPSPSGGNRQYIPIDMVEALLDQLYGWDGWQCSEVKQTVIVNEVVGTVLLKVWSDRRGQWIERPGSASVMIQMHKGSTVLDVGSKISNAMEKMAPSLKSKCLSNAAKSLGKRFGRGLNRALQEQYTMGEMAVQFKAFREYAPTANSILELEQAHGQLLPDVMSDPDILDAKRRRISELEELATLRLEMENEDDSAEEMDLFTQAK
jgi:hypothetical protein